MKQLALLPERVCISFFITNDTYGKQKILDYFLKVQTQNFQVMIINPDDLNENIQFDLMKRHFDPLTVFIWKPKIIGLNCVAVINSFQGGWVGFMQGMSEFFSYPLFFISFAKESKVYEPYFKFVYKDENETRMVSLISEGGKWKFFQKGKSQYFEDTQLYIKRNITDRLNDDILINYLQQIKVEILNKDFWYSNEIAYYFQALPPKPFWIKW